MSPEKSALHGSEPAADRDTIEDANLDDGHNRLTSTLMEKLELDQKEVAPLHSRAREEDYGHIYTGSSKFSPDLLVQSPTSSSAHGMSPLDISMGSSRHSPTDSAASPRLARQERYRQGQGS